MAAGGVAVSRIDAVAVDGHHRGRRGRDRSRPARREHLLYTLGKGSMVSEGAILGNTAHFASARTRTGARAVGDHPRDNGSRPPAEPAGLLPRRGTRRPADRRPLSGGCRTRLRRERNARRCWRRARSTTRSASARFPTTPTTACRPCAPWRTSRSPASPLRNFAHFVNALAYVKKAAAQANAELECSTARSPTRSSQACDEILAGKLHDQFVVDMIQGGAGTSTNMNANEVIANRGLELMGHAQGRVPAPAPQRPRQLLAVDQRRLSDRDQARP